MTPEQQLKSIRKQLFALIKGWFDDYGIPLSTVLIWEEAVEAAYQRKLDGNKIQAVTIEKYEIEDTWSVYAHLVDPIYSKEGEEWLPFHESDFPSMIAKCVEITAVNKTLSECFLDLQIDPNAHATPEKAVIYRGRSESTFELLVERMLGLAASGTLVEPDWWNHRRFKELIHG